MVVGAYYPEVSGGGLQCRTLVRALSGRAGFGVLTTTASAVAQIRNVIDDAQVYRLHVDPQRPWTKLRALYQLLRLMPELSRRCEVIHFHGFTQKMIILRALAWILRVPVVQKMTSLGHDDPISIRRRQGAFVYHTFASASRFVSVSPALSDQYAESGLPPSRLVFIPNGVDVDRFRPVDASEKARLRNEHRLPAASQIVTFVGFWSPEKGPDLLVEAWLSAVQATSRSSFLLFLGASNTRHPEVESHYSTRLRDRLDQEAGGRYRVVEETHAVEEFLQASDIFVLPSVREGLPNALLEAMAVGLACIAVDIPGVTGWLLSDRDNGFLIPPGDAAALTRVLVPLMADETERRNVGDRARSTVMQRFSAATLAEAYFTLYSSLARSIGT
jgi:glycosyltransferase involved in cell wall biosynthesis